jgi:hypothetical protein
MNYIINNFCVDIKIHVGNVLYVIKYFHLSVLGCYVGISYGAFVPEAILWLDVCSNQNINSSLCSVFASENCNNLRLLDLVVTRNYVVFATSFGLVKSASFALLMSDQSIAVKVTIKLQKRRGHWVWDP